MAPLLALVASLLPAGGAGSSLRVCMETRDPPWAYVPGHEWDIVDRSKTPTLGARDRARLVGLDVDVMAALARRLEASARVVPTAWVGLERALGGGRCDLIISSWTPTPDTPTAIVASAPYCEWGLLVVARSDDRRIQAVSDLGGARVGHIPDPSVARALAEMGRGEEFVLGTKTQLFQDLRSGALDAVIYDSLYVRWLVARDAAFRVVGRPLNRLGYHVGVRRSDAALAARVRAAVDSLVASGEARAIQAKWEYAAKP
ncbi:MAG TPA: ABC transporter substrate-binding protein [Vicinamibacteria bacterium]|nr:ABC transporter substrate-binding protein [Vicinamibacteria bacterium]